MSENHHSKHEHEHKHKHKHKHTKGQVINPWWTRITEGYIHGGIRRLVVTLGTWAALHTYTTVGLTVVTSCVLLIVGFFTNFTLELDQTEFIKPIHSLVEIHSDWINSPASGFPLTRSFYFIVHNNGDNVLQAHAVQVALQAMDTVQTTPGFADLCQSKKMNQNIKCRISSVTQFWDHNLTLWEEQLAKASTLVEPDEYVRQMVTNTSYPDGTPVFHELILGYYEGYNTTNMQPVDYKNAPPLNLATVYQIQQQVEPRIQVTSAKSFVIKIDIPDTANDNSLTDDFQQSLLERLAALRSNTNFVDNSSSAVHFEYFTMDGYETEMMRALWVDLPLVAVLVIIMVAATVLVFFRCNEKVQSRGMIGVYAILNIGLSLWTGYGILWCIGVPLTTVAIMIPFIVCGVGLDDTFIITGTYFRLLRQEQQQPDYDERTREQAEQATVCRIKETLDEVAVSISMTTITTLLAFMSGCFSHIPAVRWLCLYAALTLFVVFFYQITCFVAFIVLDERRVYANRRDLCIWIIVRKEEDEIDNGECTVEENCMFEEKPNTKKYNLPATSAVTTPTHEFKSAVVTENEYSIKRAFRVNSSSSPSKNSSQEEDAGMLDPGLQEPQVNSEDADENQDKTVDEPLRKHDEEHHLRVLKQMTQKAAIPKPKIKKNASERLMGWYANHLLKPVVKVIVLIVFAVYFAGTVYSTTQLHQDFQIEEYIPKDSFMTSFMHAYLDYSTVFRYIGVYFRNVDQSDPEVQFQMTNYVKELSELPQVGEDAGFFWLRDFAQLAGSDAVQQLGLDMKNMTFNEQVDLALSIPQLQQIYGQDIVRDPETGDVESSRTYLYLRHVDMSDIPSQLKMLMDQREVTERQSFNQPSKQVDAGFNFFTFDHMYFYWELYGTVVNELIVNTITCVVVVSVVAFILIPHWSAVCFVFPLLVMLYFNLMGTMQYCGIGINIITYFIIVMSIGLLVDFLMHVLLRFYETDGATRDEKVKKTLETMGTSILLGGFTTWLGVIPLAFSSTKIFTTVFICFLAMVTLGCAGGLILLPVLLSLAGPVVSIQPIDREEQGDDQNVDNGGQQPEQQHHELLDIVPGVDVITNEVWC